MENYNPNDESNANMALPQLVSRIENLEEEKKTTNDAIKEVYDEAKALGFDTKILKKVINNRKREPQEIEEEQSLIEVYQAALDNS